MIILVEKYKKKGNRFGLKLRTFKLLLVENGSF